jgi:Protein of unknown function DUF262/Protein of unknown function (DUF1524)
MASMNPKKMRKSVATDPVPIRPEYKTLWELLQGRLFRVPEYQRAYTWQSRQREDLFDDIRKLLAKRDNRHHFMATIALLGTKDKEDVGTDEFRYYDVVDGQQRLTTLILLLKALSKSLMQGDQQQQVEGNAIGQLLVKGDGPLILLQSNHDSAPLFAAYLREGTFPDDDEVKTHAGVNLRDAIRECEAFVEESTNLLNLLRAIKLRLGFVIYDLNDEAIVYTAFEVLNSRGLDVESLDKCKSMLMGQAFESSASKAAAKHRIDELHEIWRDLYRTIGRTAVSSSEILRFAATLRGDDVPNRTLGDADALALFRAQCQGEASRVTELSGWLLKVTKKVVDLRKNRRLEAVTDISQARLLAISILLSPSLKPPQRDLALRQWEMVTFRIFGLAGWDARTKVGDYTRLAHALIKERLDGENLMERLRALGEDFQIDEVVEGLRQTNCYEDWEERLRYFLYRYEEHLADEAGSQLAKDVWNKIWSASAAKTIEHIFPQNPGHEWPERLDDPAAVHWLGNLLLLPPDLNRRASNHSFAQKKKLYENNRLHMMDSVLCRMKWNQNLIAQRGKSMLEFARQAWDDIES